MLDRFDAAPQHYVRIGGLLYLILILAGLLGETYVRGTLIVPGDGLATLARIQAEQGLWRAGIGGDLLMHLLDLPLILLYYLMLRPVSRNLALLAVLFNLIQTAVLVANKSTLVLPLLLASDARYAQVSPELLGTLTSLAVQLHGHGFGVGLIFFGVVCVIKAYLMYRSTFLPRFIAVLFGAAGVSYLINSWALLLAPDLAGALFPWVLIPVFIGEVGFALWTMIRGIDTEAWHKLLAAREAGHAVSARS